MASNPFDAFDQSSNPFDAFDPKPKSQVEVDLTPIEVAPIRRRNFIKGEPQDFVSNNRQIELGRQGIAFDRPGSGPLSLEDYQDISYYSAGPDYVRNYVGKKVKDKYAPTSDWDVNDLTRVQNGKLQYLDISQPKPRWTEVDTGTLYSFGEPAMWAEMGTDVAATTAGTMIGGLASPFGGAVGGSTASGMNAYLYRKWALRRGREMGLNEGLDDDDIERLAIGTGLVSGGMAGLGAAVGGFPRSSMENSLFSRKTASGVVDDFTKNTADADRVVGDVNAVGKALGLDEQFDPTPAQRSGIGEVKNIEATLEAGHAAKATQEIAAEIKNRKVRDQRVLTQIWEGLFPSRQSSISDIENAGLNIRAEAEAVANNAPEARAAREAASAGRKLTVEANKLPKEIDYDEILTTVRGAESPDGRISGSKFYELRDDIVRRQEQLTNETIDRGRNVKVELSERTLLLPRLKALKSQLDRGLDTLNQASGDKRISGMLEELIGVIENNNGVVPFNYIDKVHQDLGSFISKVQSSPGRGIDAPNVAHLSEVASILEEAITTYSKTGPVYARDAVETWLKRKEVTRLRHDIFDRKAVRQVLASEEMDGPTGKLIFNDMFTPESSKYLGTLVDLVKNDAESMGALRNVALYRYKQAVTNPRTGEVDLAKHNAFVQKYRQHLDMLFPEGQPKPWSKIGTLEQEVVKAAEKSKQLDKLHRDAWYNVFGKNYRYNSYKLVDTLARGKLNTQQADALIAHLQKTDPAMLDIVRQEALTAVKLDFGASKLPTVDSLLKFANGVRGRNFAKLMGPIGDTYLKHITTLAEAIKMTTSEGVTLGTPSANLLTSTTRAAFGPLHRIQRFITAGRQIYQWMDATSAYEVIADPARLKTALQYAATAPSIKAIPAAIAADIGALSALFMKPEKEKD